MKTSDIVKKIKQKKELSGLADEFVEITLVNYLKKQGITLTENPKSQKLIIKDVRSELRRYTGQYQTKLKTKKQDVQTLENPGAILKTHSSTKERLDFYSELTSKIRSLQPRSILDLGCGLNPIALATNFPNSKYYAYDIQKSELDIINKFFKHKNIQGKARYANLETEYKFPKADLCLILKVFDLIDNTHKQAERILTNLNCKHIIVSFPTRKLSGKRMNSPKRRWFELMLKRLEYHYSTFFSDNEVFYLITI